MRVGIVDDHPVFRLGLRAALNHEAGIRVVWDVGTIGEARQSIRHVPVDVLLMDVNLDTDSAGIEAAGSFLRQEPALKIVMISASVDQRVVRAAFRAGATSYIAKDLHPELIARALRDSMRPPGSGSQRHTATRPFRSSSGLREVDVRSGKRDQHELTRREAEVLAAIRTGQTNREMALGLGISLTTVNKHVHRVLQKLGVRNRAQAAASSYPIGPIP
jgi:DNA-binding NarL/FixJ family response regulator